MGRAIRNLTAWRVTILIVTPEAGKLAHVVAASLDDAPVDFARQAYRSRTQFYRVFRALIDETPHAMRRRLLLERAGWQLGRTSLSVTDIALNAQFASVEAFSRAFRKAFGLSPSLYRRAGTGRYWLASPAQIHFRAQSQGETDMTLFDRFAGHDSWHTRQLLAQAAKLSDRQLDEPLDGMPKLLPWEAPERSLRELFERLVRGKEIWTAALTGRFETCEPRDRAEQAPARWLERWQAVDAEFAGLLANVEKRGAWDDTFLDALCEPPETFTFGAMFSHYITFASFKRLSAMAALRRLGVDVEGMGCPTEYEREVAPWPQASLAIS